MKYKKLILICLIFTSCKFYNKNSLKSEYINSTYVHTDVGIVATKDSLFFENNQNINFFEAGTGFYYSGKYQIIDTIIYIHIDDCKYFKNDCKPYSKWTLQIKKDGNLKINEIIPIVKFISLSGDTFYKI